MMASTNNSAGSRRGPAVTAVSLAQTSEPIKAADALIGRTLPTNTMNKDGTFTSLHMHRPRDADLFEQFCKDKLPSDDIYVPAHHQPVNPEDEDDVVPDQHAAFGIQRATQARREPAWRDFGLGELMVKGPEAGASKGIRSKAHGKVGGTSGNRALPR